MGKGARFADTMARYYSVIPPRPMSTMPDQNPAAAAAPLPMLRLKRGEDRRLRSGHLWVFSNEIDNDATPLTDIAPGALVQVHSDRDQFLGYAYVNPHALICARI